MGNEAWAMMATHVDHTWPKSAPPARSARLPLVILPLSGRSLPCAVRVAPWLPAWG